LRFVRRGRVPAALGQVREQRLQGDGLRTDVEYRRALGDVRDHVDFRPGVGAVDDERLAVDARPGNAVQRLDPEIGRRGRTVEVDGRVAAGALPEAVDGVDGDEFAVVHHAHAVTDRLHLREVVTGEEDGRSLGGALADDLADGPDAVGVESRRGLVEDQEVGVADQRHREREALLHALGVVAGQPIRVVGQANGVEEGVGVVVGAFRLDGPLQILPTQKRVVEAVALGEDAGALADVGGAGLRVEAEHLDGPARRPDEIEQDVDGRRLARAVRAEEAEDLAALDGQIEVVHGRLVAEALGQARRLDGRHGQPPPGRGASAPAAVDPMDRPLSGRYRPSRAVSVAVLRGRGVARGPAMRDTCERSNKCLLLPVGTAGCSGTEAGRCIGPPSAGNHLHRALRTVDMTFEPGAELSAAEVEERVDAVIEDNEVVLFMKGTELMPQCGYSRKALALIGQYREEFETVDVLESLDEYRGAHSGRETIPQTFVDGEFVGGSDILEQLDERGELEAKLQA